MTHFQRAAIEAARHELVMLDGLVVLGSMAPGETWTIDTSALVAQLDEALSETPVGVNSWKTLRTKEVSLGKLISSPRRLRIR